MTSLQVIEQYGKRVLTTSQLAESFRTDVRVISNNYNRNKDRYTEGKHFFVLIGDDLRQFKTIHHFDEQFKHSTTVYLWTEKGAWMHAKSLNTDEAWNAYERLVDDYYEVKLQPKTPEQLMIDAFKQMTQMAELVASTKQEVEETKETVQFHEMMLNRLDHEITNVMTIDHPRQRKIQKSVATRVYSLVEDKEKRQQLFRELYRELKDRFGVASYTDIKHKDFETAVTYIAAWVPKVV